MKKMFGLLALVIIIAFAACSPGRAVVTEGPSGRVVVVPPQPGPGYIWRGNAWRWGGGRAYRRPPVIIAPYGHPRGYRSPGRSRWGRY